MEREMYIARDNCGNWCIKAIDRDNGRFYGTKWNGYIHYMDYSKKDAIKAFKKMRRDIASGKAPFESLYDLSLALRRYYLEPGDLY